MLRVLIRRGIPWADDLQASHVLGEPGCVEKNEEIRFLFFFRVEKFLWIRCETSWLFCRHAKLSSGIEKMGLQGIRIFLN